MKPLNHPVWQAASLLHQYGEPGAHTQALWIDFNPTAQTWNDAIDLLRTKRFVCQWCSNAGVGDCVPHPMIDPPCHPSTAPSY